MLVGFAIKGYIFTRLWVTSSTLLASWPPGFMAIVMQSGGRSVLLICLTHHYVCAHTIRVPGVLIRLLLYYLFVRFLFWYQCQVGHKKILSLVNISRRIHNHRSDPNSTGARPPTCSPRSALIWHCRTGGEEAGKSKLKQKQISDSDIINQVVNLQDSGETGNIYFSSFEKFLEKKTFI